MRTSATYKSIATACLRHAALLLLLSIGFSTQFAFSQTRRGYASVGNKVWMDANNNGIFDNDEKGVANVLVTLYDSMMSPVTAMYTDANGNYRFDSVEVPANGEKAFFATYTNIPADFAYTQKTENANSSKADPITGRTDIFRLHNGSVLTNINAGIKSSPGVVLPLVIDKFDGFFADGIVQLKWTSFNGVMMDRYGVERSTDGVNFRQIGKITALGSESNKFEYLDLTADKGSNYYRLSMVDMDGNYTYSKPVMVSADVKGISVSVVYPNPFSKRVQVKIYSNKQEQIMIRTLDNAGGVVRSQASTVYPGENNIVIQNVADLPAGVYYLEVIGDHRSVKTKLMKQL